MNKYFAFALALAFALASTNAFAQQHVGKKGNKTGKQHNRPGSNAETKVMREAAQLVHEANRLLNQGLPIYQGHRVRAIQIDHLAQKEIRIGIDWEETHKSALTASAEEQIKGLPKAEERGDRTKYSREQIDASNAKLAEAYKKLGNAYTLLKNAPGEYGGHRVEAMKLIDGAGKEITKALNIRGGSTGVGAQP